MDEIMDEIKGLLVVTFSLIVATIACLLVWFATHWHPVLVACDVLASIALILLLVLYYYVITEE